MHLTGVTLYTGGAFQWYRDLFARDVAGADATMRLNEEVAALALGTEDVAFHPASSACAHHTAMRPARGFPGRQCCAHRTRTVLNGICFGLRDSLAILEQLGLPPDHLLSGGGVSAACMQSSAPGRPGNLPPVGGGELSFRHAGQHPH